MRRVPKHLAQFDRRSHVRIALKTKNEKEAQRLALIYDDFVERYWKGLITTNRQDLNLNLFQQTKDIARAHGFAYKDMSAVLESPLDEILSRIEASADAPRIKVPALLGGANQFSLTLRECPEKFWPLSADRILDKSDHQIRKFRNPRVASMKKFIEAVGNLNVSDIQRSHILQFRSWLMDKVAKGDIAGNTANKAIGQVKDLLHTVSLHEEIDLDFKLLFAEVKLKGETVSRPPFEASFVQETLLAAPALDGLNEHARWLVHMMVETGARESEIIGALPEEYLLDEPVPYLWIRKNAIRTLKNKNSERKIPLVGVSLRAARQAAKTGITRYQKNPDGASAAINKYLKENNLRPTVQHTLYSLRHTFKDRLRDAGAPEEIMDELMGHKKAGPKYGRGHMLETKHEWLQRIALSSSESLR